jgi:hypothetical protein
MKIFVRDSCCTIDGVIFCLHSAREVIFRKMLKLNRIINSNVLKGIYRSYVSVISINADRVKAIKLRPDEYEDSNAKIRVEMIDGENNLLKLDKSIAEITHTEKKFKLDCHDTKDDTTVIIELPMSECNDIEIKISAVKGDEIVKLSYHLPNFNCASNK